MINDFDDLIRWLYVIALVFLLFGFINGVRGLKAMRSQAHPEAEVAWQQAPLSPWRYEMPSMVAISLHTLGLIVLAVVLLLSVVRTGLPALLLQLSGWGVFISVFGIIFTAYMVGVLLTFHLAQRWISPVSYGVSGEGIWYGGALHGWGTFHHHEPGPEEGLISLYSSYSPPLRTWVVRPMPESFPQALELIRGHLPPTPAVVEPLAWQQSPMTLLVAMTALVLIALIPALGGWFTNQSWTWLYCFIAFFPVLALGNRMITLFGGQTKASGGKNKQR